MIVNDYKNIINQVSYSKVITIDDNDGENVYIFPDTKGFLNGIQKKRNAEKLHDVLRRIR